MSYQEKKEAINKSQDVMLETEHTPQIKLLSNLTCELTLIRLLMEDYRYDGLNVNCKEDCR